MRPPEKIANNLPKLSGRLVFSKNQVFNTFSPEGAFCNQAITGRFASGGNPLTQIIPDYASYKKRRQARICQV